MAAQHNPMIVEVVQESRVCSVCGVFVGFCKRGRERLGERSEGEGLEGEARGGEGGVEGSAGQRGKHWTTR